MRTKTKRQANTGSTSPPPFQFEKEAPKPRTSTPLLKEVLKMVNTDFDGAVPEWKQTTDDLRQVLASVIAYCDRIEQLLTAGARSNSDGTLTEVEGPRERLQLAFRDVLSGEFGRGLAGVFRPLTDRVFQIQLSLLPQKDLNDRFVEQLHQLQASTLPIPVTSALFFRPGQLHLVTQNDAAQLTLDFAHAISQLDDLRRIRKCEHCGKFHVRKKVERKPHYFCVDAPDCRKAFNNQRRKEEEALYGRQRPRKTKE